MTIEFQEFKGWVKTGSNDGKARFSVDATQPRSGAKISQVFLSASEIGGYLNGKYRTISSGSKTVLKAAYDCRPYK